MDKVGEFYVQGVDEQMNTRRAKNDPLGVQ